VFLVVVVVVINTQDDGGTCVCGDLDRIALWASQHEHEAKGIGAKARSFAEKVLGKPLVEAYLVAVLKETVKKRIIECVCVCVRACTFCFCLLL